MNCKTWRSKFPLQSLKRDVNQQSLHVTLMNGEDWKVSMEKWSGRKDENHWYEFLSVFQVFNRTRQVFNIMEIVKLNLFYLQTHINSSYDYFMFCSFFFLFTYLDIVDGKTFLDCLFVEVLRMFSLWKSNMMCKETSRGFSFLYPSLSKSIKCLHSLWGGKVKSVKKEKKNLVCRKMFKGEATLETLSTEWIYEF